MRKFRIFIFFCFLLLSTVSMAQAPSADPLTYNLRRALDRTIYKPIAIDNTWECRARLVSLRNTKVLGGAPLAAVMSLELVAEQEDIAQKSVQTAIDSIK